jgi:hypothetical protein
LFGVQIVFGDKNTLDNIMKYCVIIHNMIIEDERCLDLEFLFDNVGTRVQPHKKTPVAFKIFLRRISTD